jgi:hypothetical protein
MATMRATRLGDKPRQLTERNMIAEILRSFGLTLDYLNRLVADIPDEAMTKQTAGAVNHPAWVIGHLAFSCQAIGGEIGLAAWLPGDWKERFGTGSTPSEARAAYPSKNELLAALADGRRRLETRLREMSDAEMGKPLPDESHRAMFPTVGHAVLHILTAHAAVHVGQISVWRRVAGFWPLETPFV